jgi:hypothetical protein
MNIRCVHRDIPEDLTLPLRKAAIRLSHIW